ncbi:ComEC/Rec2 family competence protein [Roseospira goensis]|uniref:Competence protein ComEC n=1 Tax=Roseospira goensis TaxID=391922 RepID=A0A7W6WKH1_9PROT|nr:ComEC/Rec2 family competence protein [Roseospira goensis]MBB4286321.1 competence protein ComEC [Roseospira goensis]
MAHHRHGRRPGAGPAPAAAAAHTGGMVWRAPVFALAATLEAERARWPLWLPVALGCGVAAYILPAVEPPRWAGAALAAGVLLLVLVARRAAWIGALLAALVAAAVGFVAAQERAHGIAAPVLAERLGPATVSGRVVLIEARGMARHRVTLADARVAGLDAARTPARVRLTLTRAPPPRPGAWIRTRAVLMPPPPPAAPGGYDFRRRAWFEGLGAVGFAVADWGPLDLAPAPTLADRLVAWREGARQTVADRLRAGLPGQPGALATALATGDRGAVPEPVLEAFRASGLAHLLAISGLHMSMIAALLFVGGRAGLALVPAWAARWDLKKPCAVLALAGTFAYLMLAGGNVPAQRAFLMTALVLAAVLLNRTAISPRLVAWAAVAVLLTQPHALLGPSFQMSFAAVLALVATWELAAPRLATAARPRRPLAWALARTVGLYLGGVLLTSLVAGLATMPFAAVHFNRVAVFGLAANMVAVPLMGLWVMPWLLATLLLLPLGLEGWALAPLAWGLEGVAGTAAAVAGWPGATRLVPAAPAWGLAVLVLGGLWLCLWRRPWRLLGLAAIAAGLASPWSRPLPDLVVNADARAIAVRAADGGLILSPGRADGFARAVWVERWGGASAESWPEPGSGTADGRLRCDPRGCVLAVGGVAVALAWHRAALAEDCARTAVVVTPVPVPAPESCAGPGWVVDRAALAAGGVHALWLADGTVRIETVTGTSGRRLWTGPPIP